jgi:hypothetical protein
LRRRLASLLLLPLGTGLALGSAHDSGASGPSEVLLRAMRDELQRTTEQLRVAEFPPSYFVAYTVIETFELSIEGSFGGLERSRESAARQVQVELRVGSRAFDDGHFIGGQAHGLRAATGLLPLEDDYDALRAEIWRLTDEAYKAALERLTRKNVYRASNNIAEVLPDLTEDPVQSSRKTAPAGSFSREGWERAVREISGAFRDFPAIQKSSVELDWKAQHVYFVDSEGRSYVRPDHGFELALSAAGQAADGMEQSDERGWLWSALAQVPPAAELKREAQRLAGDVTALINAPQAEAYVGPVLLEEQAAGEFFSQLLASSLAAPREIWAEQEWARKHYVPGALTGRVGSRVISPFFGVVDDPTRAEFHGTPLAGHYEFDDQGILARRVELVERGILRDLLMSRSPVEKRGQSNGHGRGGFSGPATAVVGNLFVTPAKSTSLAKLRQRLREEARAFGLDHAIVVRRIAGESERDEDQLLARPVLVYRVDVASGEERLVRDAEFSAVTFRALRDITAASSEPYVYNLAKAGPYPGSATASTSIVHPAVLLAELELVRTDEKPSRPPQLPHPLFGR